jgi:DNA repair protein RecN (Recombination protein N)
MIERLYLKENLVFSSVDLEFDKGLIVFTGASGSGKSVLMNSFLSAFGLKDSEAGSIEITLDNNSIGLEDFGIESDDVTVFKRIKKGRIRYFVNNQTISKKSINSLGTMFIKYISLRDPSDFYYEEFLKLIDTVILEKESDFSKILAKYQSNFNLLESKKKELYSITERIKEIAEKQEFIMYELQKLEDISPKQNEDEELLSLKQQLSKKDKIENNLSELDNIFSYEKQLKEIFDFMEMSERSFTVTDFFSDIQDAIEEVKDRLARLDSVDIEKILQRLETLSDLKAKYGSVEKALEYRQEKRLELKEFEELGSSKKNLETEIYDLEEVLFEFADTISQYREKYINQLSKYLEEYVSLLNMSSVRLELTLQEDLNYFGENKINIFVENTELSKLSHGEQNRFRLALLTLKAKFISDESGILFLDEIDANLSGDESQKVANLLKELSNKYQIFTISHQPQLTSSAHHHFVVKKQDGESQVTELMTKESRAEEIARMVGGSNFDKETYTFALNLLESELKNEKLKNVEFN